MSDTIAHIHALVAANDVDGLRACFEADPGSRDAVNTLMFGRTAVHLATQQRSVDTLSALIEAGGDVNLPASKGDWSGFYPLHMAAKSGSVEVATLLLDSGADINVQAASGATPLHIAASVQSVDVISMLLDRGAAVAISDNTGHTAVQYALIFGKNKASDALISRRVPLCAFIGNTDAKCQRGCICTIFPTSTAVLSLLVTSGLGLMCSPCWAQVLLTCAMYGMDEPLRVCDAALRSNGMSPLHEMRVPSDVVKLRSQLLLLDAKDHPPLITSVEGDLPLSELARGKAAEFLAVPT